MGKDTLKIGIVGSRKYENRKKIKEFIFKLKNEKGSDTIVVGNGSKFGAGKYVKKYTYSRDLICLQRLSLALHTPGQVQLYFISPLGLVNFLVVSMNDTKQLIINCKDMVFDKRSLTDETVNKLFNIDDKFLRDLSRSLLWNYKDQLF